jgi:hypothetical protein
MLENLVRVGIPSFFPYAPTVAGGPGGLCSLNVINGVANGPGKFLPFVANGINYVATQGQDVISAHFTGCIMASFDDGGTRKVCHVSTGSDFGDCKPAWNALKKNFTNVFEFRPSDFVGSTPHAKCYGLITADLQMYTILVQPKRVPVAGGGFAAADEQFVQITKAHPLRPA